MPRKQTVAAHVVWGRVLMKIPYLLDPKPEGKVIGVGQSCGEPHHSHRVLGVSRNEVGARHDDLKHRASFISQQVDLINDQEPQCLHIASRLPAATDAVPLLRRGHNHIRTLNGMGVGGGVSSQFHHPRRRGESLDIHSLSRSCDITSFESLSTS